jgi:hypothetical protein
MLAIGKNTLWFIREEFTLSFQDELKIFRQLNKNECQTGIIRQYG